nr:immunoglobulin light chain junction region [Macaca mulatta]
CLQTRSSPYSF